MNHNPDGPQKGAKSPSANQRYQAPIGARASSVVSFGPILRLFAAISSAPFSR